MCKQFTWCDYCVSTRGILTQSLAGKKYYICADCMNKMDEYVNERHPNLLHEIRKLAIRINKFNINECKNDLVLEAYLNEDEEFNKLLEKYQEEWLTMNYRGLIGD